VTTAVTAGEVTLREMAPPDVTAALRLSRASAWNQTEADWRFLLEENRGRFVVAVRDGIVVGTGGASCYGDRLAWVCMILVDPAARGRGIGSAIVAAVLDRLADVKTVGLDATPAGRPVYERLGFVPACGLVRVGGVASIPAATRGATRPLEAGDLPSVLALDLEAFGAGRARVIGWARERMPALAWCAMDEDRVAGYCLGREGDRALHVGPVIARSATAACDLVASAASSVPGKELMLDVSTSPPEWAAALRDLGLREQRPFTRMYRGDTTPPGRPQLTFAAFGPELG
jgi:GNAT superfamily N-acetyltransferase